MKADLRSEIRGALNPDQRERYDQLLQEKRESRRHKDRDRGRDDGR
jgi:hypothetical protein